MPFKRLRTPKKLPDVDEAVQPLATVEAIANLISLDYAGKNLADAKPQLVSAALAASPCLWLMPPLPCMAPPNIS